jgi:MHS family proline/betaine transporter-like MFS transporter
VIVSIIIRMKMQESPLFAKLKSEGKTSVNPLKESFGHKTNFKMVLLALFGATMGQGVIWYTSQFYAQNFILTRCFVEYEQANTILLIALAIATPFFIIFGSLSDKWGRKNIMMIGMLLGVVFYRPIFNQLYSIADTSKKEVSVNGAIRQVQNASEQTTTYTDGTLLTTTTKTIKDKTRIVKEVRLGEAGKWKMIGLVTIMVLFVTLVYGPIAAFLVEMFPTRIRYTSMSLPYHIGNGVFGGLVPFIGILLTTFPGANHLSGLWYPIVVAALCVIIGGLYLSNTIDQDVTD